MGEVNLADIIITSALRMRYSKFAKTRCNIYFKRRLNADKNIYYSVIDYEKAKKIYEIQKASPHQNDDIAFVCEKVFNFFTKK
jgi:hypothetical protein